MISNEELNELFKKLDLNDTSEPFSTLIIPGKDFIIDEEILEDIITELDLRRREKWELYVKLFG